jgi:hypothetical protein
MRMRFRLNPKAPLALLLSPLSLLGAWWAARVEHVSSAGRFIWGGFAAGVLLGIAGHIEQIRRGWLPKRDKAWERFLIWRIGVPVGCIGSAIIRLFDLDWAGVMLAATFAGLLLPFIVKPDLPEREVRGWWR